MVDLSVVLPAYNEAAAIGGSLQRLAAYLETAPDDRRPWRSWEILVVDDGSVDDTTGEARRAGSDDARIRVVRLEAHSGKGAAVAAGVADARGAFILVTDVDLSYALEDLGSAAEALMRGEAPGSGPVDMVTGDRRHPASRMDLSLSALGHVMRRQAVSAAFNLLVRVVYGIPWRDTQCGLKGFRAEAAGRIVPRARTRGFLADIEMFLVAERLGMRVARIPVHLTYLSGDSTVHVVRQAPRVLLDALRIKIAQMAGRYEDRSDRGT